MRRVVPVVLIALLALPLLAGPAAATPSHENTSFAVEIQEDGDAVWTIATTYNLENESDRAAFEQVRADHVTGTDPVPDPALFEAAIESVASETNRDMALADVNRSATVEAAENGSLGVLRVSFTWTNFAVVTEDEVSVEAAFAGGWFGDLAANQTLKIEPPPEYRPLRANPSTDIVNGGLQWKGPQSFDEGEPTVVFEGFEPPPPGIERILSPMVAGIGGVILGAALIFAWRRGYVGGEETASESETSEPATASAPEADSAAAGATDDESETSDTATEVDPALLSDEERVLHLLREHDGRMKQAKIVEKTRWSNAKVSQLLSGMAEDDQIEKLRIGRENLISLPEDDRTD